MAGQRAVNLIGLTQKTKPLVRIILNDAQEGTLVPSYTTLEKIEGKVTIRAPCDLGFGEVQISFEGVSKTFVELISPTPSARNVRDARHTFLRLYQPIDAATVPSNRTFEANRTYSFPFTFVVPERLLPQACKHSCSSEHVHNAHLALPPSLGDPLVASDGTNLLSDLTSQNSLISYTLRVLVTRSRHNADKSPLLVDETKKLRVIPSSEEHPPIEILEGKDHGYAWRNEKGFRKGILKGKLGRLTIEAVQPKSLRLQQVQRRRAFPVTTMAVINLRFDPSDEESQPPTLGTLVSKLKAVTFYSVQPIQGIPTQSAAFSSDSNHGQWHETIPLSSRNVKLASWIIHDSSIPLHQQPRRDSAASMGQDTIPCPSKPLQSRVFYSNQILIPVSLPTNTKAFVPTFHTCLISRSYILDLSLSVQSPGKVILDPTMHLRIPLQLSSEGNADAQPLISPAEARAIAARESIHALLPRSMAPPSPEYTERVPILRDTEDHQMYHPRSALPPPNSVNTARVETVIADETNSDGANPPEYSAFASSR